ncbi:MAG: ROK family protein [Candidatus Nanohaloarchaea archaeon]
MAFLCIDIGGTNTLIGLGNGDFEEKKRIKSREFLSDIDGCIQGVVDNAGYSKENINQVAVAAAGPMNREKGVFYPPNLSEDSELDEVQLRKPMEAFGELHIINDCTAAVKGEYEYGASAENMVYITISSGIGLGAIFNGEIIEGADGNFGEIGHMKVNGDLECGCGRKGHWEAYSSGNRLPVMAKNLFDLEYEGAIDLFQDYNSGSSEAAKVIEKMQEVNAEAFANVISLYNPEKIVFGGPVALNHTEIVIDEVREEIERKAVNEMPDIVPAELSDQSVLHGLRAHCNKN